MYPYVDIAGGNGWLATQTKEAVAKIAKALPDFTVQRARPATGPRIQPSTRNIRASLKACVKLFRAHN
jgi:hypothetical protein